MPHLLRFLLLSATSVNVGRIISQIREQLKFVGVSDPCVAKQKMLKGKYLADSTEASILDALRSSLRFKNVSCVTLHIVCEKKTAQLKTCEMILRLSNWPSC